MLGKLFMLLKPLPSHTYFPTLLADFIRDELLQSEISFVFETVMSDPGKVDLLRRAQEKGYRTYLYFICVGDPGVNIERVADRVANGGHHVPTEKIINRYHRSLANAVLAVPYTHRAFFWDNSATSHEFLAEIREASHLEISVDNLPFWFEEDILGKL